MKTDATERDERSKDQECCTDHALPCGCDRISRACGQSRWLAGKEAAAAGVGDGAEWDVYPGAGTPIQDAIDDAGWGI